MGYLPKPWWSDSERARAERIESRDLLVRLGTAAFLSSQVMMFTGALYAGFFQGIEGARGGCWLPCRSPLTLPVFVYSGAPFLRSAAAALRHLRFNMDVLVAVGAGAAMVASVVDAWRAAGQVYFDTAAMIVTLVLAGRDSRPALAGGASEAVRRSAG